MIRVKFIYFFLNIFDFFQQRKVFNFLKKKISENSILFDVGAHHGETIKNFKKNFKYNQIHSFEASSVNFKILKYKISNIKNENIFINNFGLSDDKKILNINQSKDSASSTLSEINSNSKYYKKKIKMLGISNQTKYFNQLEVKLIKIDDYISEKNLNKIDLLKIDTEGHEYYVLKGALKNLTKIKYVYFEHHYDDMIKKGYKFSEINYFLISNNFKMVFKSKMYFRKTFEYIYENSTF